MTKNNNVADNGKDDDDKRVEEAIQSVTDSNVSVNLDVDPNDPRKHPAVDGGSQPKVDINKPIPGVKEAA